MKFTETPQEEVQKGVSRAILKHFASIIAKIEDIPAVYACSLQVLYANFLPSFRKNFLSTYVAVLFLKSRVRNFDADALCSRYVRHAKVLPSKFNFQPYERTAGVWRNNASTSNGEFWRCVARRRENFYKRKSFGSVPLLCMIVPNDVVREIRIAFRLSKDRSSVQSQLRERFDFPH